MRLKINQLSVSRGDFHIHLPELELSSGDIYAIQGASGCGKSTLLEVLGLILKPDQVGYFELNGQDMTRLVRQADRQLAQYRAFSLGFMLQTGGLLPFLTVQENIALPCQLLAKSLDSVWLTYLGEQLNILPLLNKYPKQLSIGERQRVSFLRSIAHKPSILLADEPTAALDPNNAACLLDIIIKLVKEMQLSALIVSHDWDIIKKKGLPYLHCHIEGNHAMFLRGIT